MLLHQTCSLYLKMTNPVTSNFDQTGGILKTDIVNASYIHTHNICKVQSFNNVPSY